MLRQRIKDILDATSEPKTSREVADEVLTGLSSGDRKVALEECLPHYVSHLIRTIRGANIDALEEAVTQRKRSGHDNVSMRWQNVIESRVFNIGGKLYRLSECTREDLVQAIAEYDERIMLLAKPRDQYVTIVKLFDANPQASKVSDLPEESVIEALTT